MRNVVLAFLSLIFIAACQHKVDNTSVYDKEKMLKVTWDLIKANDFAGQFLFKDTSKNLKLESIAIFQKVFALNKTTRDEYLFNYKYYVARPAAFHEIMDSMSVRANRDRGKAYGGDTSLKKTPIKVEVAN
jgi:hypothetical protein